MASLFLEVWSLTRQWACIIRQGPVGCVDWASLMDGPGAGLTEFGARVDVAILVLLLSL